MPSLSQLPGDLNRKKLTKALTAPWFYKYTLNYLLKEIETISGVTWDDVKNKI